MNSFWKIAVLVIGLCGISTVVSAEERITDTYGYTLKSDPYNNMQIQQAKDPFIGNIVNEAYYLRDDDFFGKSTDGIWEKTGKLDYNSGNIDSVKNAVESGNYDLAKSELLDYYKSKSYTKNTISSSTDIMTADLLGKNFMYNARSGLTLQSYMYVDGTAKYTSADVSNAMKTYASSHSQMTFLVLADDKDKYTVSFDSKEGENKPYMKVISNGKEVTLYTIDDTYINASTNASKNYGSNTDLQVCESAIDTSALVNVYTKRVYLKFDTSALSNVTSAKLYMYGYNKSAQSEKELVVFYSDDSSWEEESATYNNVTAQVIYSYDQSDTWGWDKPAGSGSRYAEELLRFDTWFDKLVKAYNYTGNEKYAYTALRQLMDFINVRGDEPTHLVTLDVAVRTQCLPKLFMQLLDSQYMTPDIFTAFMKYMYVEANASQHFTRSGNWGTSESEGLFITAVYFREFTDSDAWINRVRTRYEELLGDIVNSDYSCTELSLGYVDYTISTIIGAKDVADEIGTDISPYSDETLANLEKMGLYMYYMSMPGVRDNQMGDGYSYSGSYRNRLKYLSEWFNNPELAYACSGGTSGIAPKKTSMLFDVGKKAVMRSDWTDNARYLYTNVDGGIGNHGHADDNEIILYAYGKYLLVDPLYGTYSTSTSRTWLMSSIAHNTVTMNSKNQYYASGNAKRGSVEKWESNDGYDYIKETSVNVQDAKSYTRSILSVKDMFYIVNDYIVPNNTLPNKYVQAWHFLPTANISVNTADNVTDTNMSGANLKVVPVNTDSISRAQKVQGLYSSGQGSIQNAYYTEYEKNSVGNTAFNTILVPEKSGENVSVTYDSIIDTADLTAYKMNVGGDTYLFAHNNANSIVSANGYETDAQMLLIGFDTESNINFVAANDISYLKYGEKTIFSSGKSIPAISVSFEDKCDVYGSEVTSEMLKENSVSIYAPKSDSITVNGEAVTTRKNNDAFVFTDFEYPLVYDVNDMNYAYDTEIKLSELEPYGFNYNTSTNIYSVRKINSEKSVYCNALRFSTRQYSTIQEKTDIMSISFDNDIVNMPEEFLTGKYIFESEFAVQNKDSGDIRLSFNDGDNAFARVCFKKTSSGTYIHSGKVYAVNGNEEMCGNEQEIKISSDISENTAGQMFYLKAEIDMNAQSMSIWLVPRASDTEAYAKIPVSEEFLLVSDMSIDAAEFNKISFDVTNNKYENSVWLSNVSITKQNEVSAKINTENIFLNQGVLTNATIYNPKNEELSLKLISAQYDKDNKLIKIGVNEKNTSEAISEIIDNTELYNDTDYVKVFVWDNSMFSYGYRKAYKTY